MIAVSVERNRYLQSRPGQTHAELVIPSQAPREHSLQKLWKEYSIRGEVDEVRREEAGKITILRISPTELVAELGLDIALACGFKTSQGLQEHWFGLHPRSPEVRVVWFALGDWRDRDRYMNFTGRAGGDYTMNRARAMDPDAPVPDEVIEFYVSTNRLKDEARRAKESAALSRIPASERFLRLLKALEFIRVNLGEAAYRAAVAECRQHFRVIEQRVRRGETRKEIRDDSQSS